MSSQELATRLAEGADVVIPTLYGPPDTAAAILSEMSAAGVTTVGPPAEAVSLVADRQGSLYPAMSVVA